MTQFHRSILFLFLRPKVPFLQIDAQVKDAANLSLPLVKTDNPTTQAMSPKAASSTVAASGSFSSFPQVSRADSTEEIQHAGKSAPNAKKFDPDFPTELSISEHPTSTRVSSLPPQAEVISTRNDTGMSHPVAGNHQRTPAPLQTYSSASQNGKPATTPFANISTSWEQSTTPPNYNDQAKGKSRLEKGLQTPTNREYANITQKTSYQNEVDYSSSRESYAQGLSQTAPAWGKYDKNQREQYGDKKSSGSKTLESKQPVNPSSNHITNTSGGSVISTFPTESIPPAVSSSVINAGNFSSNPPKLSIASKSGDKKAKVHVISASSAPAQPKYSSYTPFKNASEYAASFGADFMYSTVNNTLSRLNSSSLSRFPCQNHITSNQTHPKLQLGCSNSSHFYTIDQKNDGNIQALEMPPKPSQSLSESGTSKVQAIPMSQSPTIQFNSIYGTSEWRKRYNNTATSQSPKSTPLHIKPSRTLDHAPKGFNGSADGVFSGSSPNNSFMHAQNVTRPTNSALLDSSASTTSPVESKQNNHLNNISDFGIPSSGSLSHYVKAMDEQLNQTRQQTDKWLISVQNSSSDFSGQAYKVPMTRTSFSKPKDLTDRTGTASFASDQTRASIKGVDSYKAASSRSSLFSSSSISIKTHPDISTKSSWPKTFTEALGNQSYSSNETFHVTKKEKITAISVGVGFSVGILVLAILGGLLKRRALRQNPVTFNISRPKNIEQIMEESLESQNDVMPDRFSLQFSHDFSYGFPKEFLQQSEESVEDSPNQIDEFGQEMDHQYFENPDLTDGAAPEAAIESHAMSYDLPNGDRDDEIQRYISYASSFGNFDHRQLEFSPRDNGPGNALHRYELEAVNQRDTAGDSTFLPITFGDSVDQRAQYHGGMEDGIDPLQSDGPWNHFEHANQQRGYDAATEVATRFSDEEIEIEDPPAVPWTYHHPS